MPLYEYQCENCQKTFEVIQKFSDVPLRDCPDCGKSVEKLMSLGSFQLKGSGWYNTDYRKNKTAPQTNSEAPACASPSAGCGKPACSTN